MRSYSRDDPQKILEEEAKALEQFNKVRFLHSQSYKNEKKNFYFL